MSAVLSFLLRHWQAAALTAAVVVAFGMGAAYLNSRDDRIRAEERARVAEAAFAGSLADVAAGEAAFAIIEAQRAEDARELARLRQAEEQAVVDARQARQVARAQVTAAADSLRVTLTEAQAVLFDSVEVANGRELTALEDELAAQVQITAAADSLTSIWIGRYRDLETVDDAKDVALANAQAAIAAGVTQINAGRPSRLRQAAWGVGLLVAGNLLPDLF